MTETCFRKKCQKKKEKKYYCRFQTNAQILVKSYFIEWRYRGFVISIDINIINAVRVFFDHTSYATFPDHMTDIQILTILILKYFRLQCVV